MKLKNLSRDLTCQCAALTSERIKWRCDEKSRSQKRCNKIKFFLSLFRCSTNQFRCFSTSFFDDFKIFFLALDWYLDEQTEEFVGIEMREAKIKSSCEFIISAIVIQAAEEIRAAKICRSIFNSIFLVHHVLNTLGTSMMLLSERERERANDCRQNS